MRVIKSIQNLIYELRNMRIIPDFDLATLYEVPAKVQNQAVKRNSKQFPKDFMFKLTPDEWKAVWSQVVTTT